MESQALLTIDKKPISFVQALGYLRTTGDDQAFILKILRQHLLETELQSHDNLKIEPNIVEQAIVQIRTQNQLVSQEQFEIWLKESNLTYDSLRNKIETQLKIEKLKQEVTESKVEVYFEQNKGSLEQVVLSRIVVADQTLAETLKTKILEDNNSFGELAREHSLTSDRYANGIMPVVAIGQLPEPIKSQVQVTPPGTLMGPVVVEGGYCLLRVEEFIPVTLNEPLKQQIQNQLFELWLAEKLENAEVKLHVL